MTRSWSIFLAGRVPTKGSYKAGKRGTVRSDCSWLNEWTGWACAEVLASDPPTWQRHEPVSVQMQIAVKRPDAHFTKSGKLNATGRKYPAPTRREDGDWDKHARAVFDMLVMAGVLADDADIVSPDRKGWMQWETVWVPPGLRLTVADFVPEEHPPDPVHYATWDDSHTCVQSIQCEPGKGPFPLAMVSGIVSFSRHGVSCRLCREMLGMSKGIR